jgi:glycosyltransferase involved in cell wall biosynthesis
MASVRVSASTGKATGPRFSVVIPAYQAAATLRETLDAIRAQTFTDWECVVVDDGSTDDTLTIATGYSQRDPRFRVVHQVNQGTAGAYNAGVSSAVGDYVVVCSADDILLPEHLSKMAAFVDAEAGYDIYSSNGYFWMPGEFRALVYDDGESQAVHSLALADVIHRCFFSVGATYRRDLHTEVGGYRVGVYGEDYDFWLRAIASGARHRYLPEALALHRISETQKSAQLEKVYRSDIRLVSELRRDFPLSLADSRVVDDAIRERNHRIADLNRPWGLYQHRFRPAARRLAYALVGRERARRIARALRSAIGPTTPR